MSLVNDALKKARLEAARQDAARRGLPMPGTQLATGPRVGSQTLVRIGVVAAVALLALLLFLAGGRFGALGEPRADATAAQAADSRGARLEETAAPGERAEPPPAPPRLPAPDQPSNRPQSQASDLTPGPTPAPAPAASQDVPPATGSVSSASPRSATEPSGAVSLEPRSASPPARPAKPPEPTPPTPDRSRSTASSPSRQARATGGRAETPPAGPGGERRVRIVSPGQTARPAAAEAPKTAVRVLELPGAVRIELGGIAWSEERPFALMNGRVVGPGDVVESLAVVAIAQRHVELQGDAGHFLLRLK